MADKRPNVVYIVLDDLGFSQLECYGSTIHTPNINRLAQQGLRYNNFHTTAICSATRASLLTGANHHSVGINSVVEMKTGFENGQGGINPQYATIAEILREYDYRTIACGKWHLTDGDSRTAAGPYDNWPLGKGFESYYGFLAADMDQWNPVLTRDNTMVLQPEKAKDGYHFSEDITENAIHYLYDHEFSYPEQPFFLYLAYGAMHAPHHAPKEYIDKYRGKFDKGWDVIREEWFANQKKLGIIPQDAELNDRNEYVKPWDSLTEKQKKAYARYMEVFAGYLEHTDAQIGRLLDYLEEAQILDDTVIVLISDNGASAEGGQDGHYNLNTSMDVTQEYERDVDLILENFDTVGDEYSAPHYPIGWANAGNTPFQWYKIWTHEGGIKDPLIISYPNGIKDKGGIRGQYHHVIDITPTILDIIGVKKPETIKGIPQKPLQGISMKYTFNNVNAKDERTVQYFEMHGNRGIYKDGWKAVVNHTFNKSYDEDKWELYHVAEDYSEKHNVADKYPEKVKELEEEWLVQAGKYGVFPLLSGDFHAYRDQLFEVFTSISLPEHNKTYRHIRYAYDIPQDLSLGNRTHTFTAILNRKAITEKGVLISKGDRFGGITLYVKDNRIKYVYNVDADTYYVLISKEELPLGEVKVQLTFTVTGKEKATAQLFINGEDQGSVNIEQFHYTTSPITTIKANKYTPVYDDYEIPFEYDGIIEEINIYAPETSGKLGVEKTLHHD